LIDFCRLLLLRLVALDSVVFCFPPKSMRSNAFYGLAGEALFWKLALEHNWILKNLPYFRMDVLIHGCLLKVSVSP
jgi:hypothetical protein